MPLEQLSPYKKKKKLSLFAYTLTKENYWLLALVKKDEPEFNLIWTYNTEVQRWYIIVQ